MSMNELRAWAHGVILLCTTGMREPGQESNPELKWECESSCDSRYGGKAKFPGSLEVTWKRTVTYFCQIIFLDENQNNKYKYGCLLYAFHETCTSWHWCHGFEESSPSSSFVLHGAGDKPQTQTRRSTSFTLLEPGSLIGNFSLCRNHSRHTNETR